MATTIPEADATPDEAFELGHLKGYDEACDIAMSWVRENIGVGESGLMFRALYDGSPRRG